MFRRIIVMIRNLIKGIDLRSIAFYAALAILLAFISISLPYQVQVYIAIVAGFAVASLMLSTAILSRRREPLDLIFMAGIAFLFVGLYKSDLPTRATLENIRHLSLIISVTLTGIYVAARISRRGRTHPSFDPIQNLSRFLSVFSATLSSELCSCLHPTLILEAIGFTLLIPNQVRLGFILMMITLAYQLNLTYRSIFRTPIRR
ncbi:hypothetical protein KEJ35_05455 [Candidatus Bathyarchaeota archaeon]|nr:hypothetical protein [Candidatus Bathyarchaeota archaeon]